MPSGTPFLPLIRALSITFVRFLLYYFSIFLAKCAMQADDAFCYFNVVFFAPPFFLSFPFLYNCTFDAEEFDKSVVHKMSAVDFCGATAPEKEQHVSTTSATFSLEGRGGISRKMIKGPQYKQTASFSFRAHPYTHSKSLLLLIRRMSSAEFRRNIFDQAKFDHLILSTDN